MLSYIKIIHFWLSSGPCLTVTKQFWKIWMKTEAHSACFISSLWMDYVISFCRKPLESTQGFKMNTSFAIVFPTNILFQWPPCYLKSLKFNETAIAITRLINFLFGVIYFARRFCLLHLSSSIPFEVLHEDAWHSIVFNQCKNSAEKSKKNQGVLPL